MANGTVISVVDDEKSVRNAARALLKSLGYSPATFASAEEFLQSGCRRETACLITDVQMPGMSGVDLQDHLIASGDRTPVIFVTAYPEGGLRLLMVITLGRGPSVRRRTGMRRSASPPAGHRRAAGRTWPPSSAAAGGGGRGTTVRCWERSSAIATGSRGRPDDFPLYVRRLHALAAGPDHPWLSKIIGEGLGVTERSIGELTSFASSWFDTLLQSVWSGGWALISVS